MRERGLPAPNARHCPGCGIRNRVWREYCVRCLELLDPPPRRRLRRWPVALAAAAAMWGTVLASGPAPSTATPRSQASHVESAPPATAPVESPAPVAPPAEDPTMRRRRTLQSAVVRQVEQGLWEDGAESVRGLLDLDPEGPRAALLHRARGSLLERARRYAEAAGEYREYARRMPEAADALPLLVWAAGLEEREVRKSGSP